GRGAAVLFLVAPGVRFADGEVFFALDGLDVALAHLAAADADRFADHDAGERDPRPLGGAAADVDDHVARRLGDGQPGADRRRHRLFDQVDLPRAGALGRLAHRALLDLGDAERDADDDARADQALPVVDLLDEAPEHRFGHLE